MRNKLIKQIKNYLLLICISFLITLLTACLAEKIHNNNELSNVKYGFPIAFISQNLSSLSPPKYPYKVRILSPLENPTTFNKTNFIICVFYFFIILEMISYFIDKLYHKKQ